jgi:WXG100 family type VII secretion target
MSIMDFDPNAISGFVEHIRSAQINMREIVEGLDCELTHMEKSWTGDAQRAFLRFYKEWRKGVMTHADALKQTAEHLHALVEQYQTIQ